MSRQRVGIPIGEAAEVLGLNVDAVRKRIKRGTLDAYKQDERWYVVLPGVQPAPSSPLSSLPGRTTGGPVQDDGDQRNNITLNPVTPAEVERAIEATATRYMADFAGLYDRISADVAARYEKTIAAKDEALATKDETIAELRRRAEVAEAELSLRNEELWRHRQDSPPQASPPPRTAEEAPPAHDDTPIAPAPVQGFWQRLRRAISGE